MRGHGPLCSTPVSADTVSCSISESYVGMTDCQDLADGFGGLRWNLTLLKFGRLVPCQWAQTDGNL